MKKTERKVAADIVRLFRAGKLDFSYFHNPLFTSIRYDHRDDHEFITKHNGVQIRLGRKQIFIDDKQSEANHPPSMAFDLTKELQEVYDELCRKHEAEIREIGDAQGEYKKQLDDARKKTRQSNQDAGSMLERLQS